MNRKIHLWDINKTEAGGMTMISATVEYPDRNKSNLWYSFPSEYGSYVQENRMDAFVIATQLMAMNLGADLYVHGIVAPSLLENLEEFRAIWACWSPSFYKPIEVKADVEQELSRTEEPLGNIMAFSGGVDACFTAYRHFKGFCGRQNKSIKAGVLIGFNSPPKHDKNFNYSIEKARKILNSVGMQLIPLSTNLISFKTLDMRKYKLHDAFLPGVISCLMLFQKSYDAGLIASGFPYNQMLAPWSTHPMVDPLLSHNSFRVVHDGASFSRTQKVEIIKDWPEALDNIYVCWNKETGGGNCGKCSKCIRTILNFRAVGATLPGCFKEDISEREILSQVKLGSNSLDSLEEIFWAAEKASISDSWVKAVRILFFEYKF